MKDQPDPDLCALMGSRLCHDLISPIGAIANGMELLEMTSDVPSPEMALIRQSVDDVNARIRFFRIAFGMASSEQQTGRNEIAPILRDYFPSPRLDVAWHPQEDVPRREAKGAFLALLCVTGALPSGGSVEITRDGSAWCLTGRGDKLRIVEEGWQHLEGRGPVPEAANDVHFALLRNWAAEVGREVQCHRDAAGVEIRF